MIAAGCAEVVEMLKKQGSPASRLPASLAIDKDALTHL